MSDSRNASGFDVVGVVTPDGELPEDAVFVDEEEEEVEVEEECA